jgi:hypothetical protein
LVPFAKIPLLDRIANRAAEKRAATRKLLRQARKRLKDLIAEQRAIVPHPELISLLEKQDPVAVIILGRRGDVIMREAMIACGARRLPVLLVLGEGEPLDMPVPRPRLVLVAGEPPREGESMSDGQGGGVVWTRDPFAGSLLTDTLDRDLLPVGRKKRLTRSNERRNSISEAYSANYIVASYMGRKEPVGIPGYWMHGWIPAFHARHPGIVAMHKALTGKESPEARLERIDREKQSHAQFLARRDQADFLRSQGYRHTHAIGLPFAYLPEVHVPRKAGSLLIVPPHGRGCHGLGDPLAEAYATYIAERASRFSSVTLVVTAGDQALGQWVTPFKERGIAIEVGASANEQDTLFRLKTLLSSVEYVTTNGFGSHIAYAAACGAKVSVAGPYAEWPEGGLRRAFEVRTYPELLEVQTWLASERAMRDELPFLFTEPELAEDRTAWGKHEIGADLRLAPEELQILFSNEEGRLYV